MPQIKDPNKLFEHELGMALGAERKILSMLKKVEGQVQDGELKQQIVQHRDETEGQIRNIEQAFQAIGGNATGHHAEVVDGLQQESEKMIEMVDDALVDAVVLGGVVKTEHLEIAMYEGLITKAEAMGQDDIVALLQENLEQEQRTLQLAEQHAEQLSQRLATSV